MANPLADMWSFGPSAANRDNRVLVSAFDDALLELGSSFTTLLYFDGAAMRVAGEVDDLVRWRLQDEVDRCSRTVSRHQHRGVFRALAASQRFTSPSARTAQQPSLAFAGDQDVGLIGFGNAHKLASLLVAWVRIPLMADSDSISIADSVPGDGGHVARVS